MTTIIFLGAIILVLTLFVYVFFLHPILADRKRQKEMKRASPEIGFTYNEVADIELPDLKLFSIGSSCSPEVKSLLTTTRFYIKWSLFDYQFLIGENAQKQTVVMAQLDNELPEFYLSRERFYHKFGEIIGFKDIDLQNYPEFSERYRLKGADEKAIRQLFTPQVISIITNQQLEAHIEAKGNFIIIYTPGRIVEPADLYSFFQKASIVINLFK